MAVMQAPKFLCLTILCSFLQGAVGLNWTSAGPLPDGATIPACSGQNVTLPWSFQTSGAEHVLNVEWHFYHPDGTDELLATQVGGNYFADPNAALHVQFVPPSGIRLHNVATADTGTYSVRVNVNLHGSVVEETQNANVRVSDDPLTDDGQLHVHVQPSLVLDSADHQYHTLLSCGHFRSEWAPHVKVTWQTPDGHVLNSTSRDGGRFLLAVPNPVISGNYTCAIESTSPAGACIKSGSPLESAAVFNLDELDARFSALEAQAKADQMAMQESIRLLQEQNAQILQENADMRNQLSSLTSKLIAAYVNVGFHASLHQDLVRTNDTLTTDSPTTNFGHAFNPSTGVFTAPFNGSYVFLATVVTSSNSPLKRDVQVDLVVDEESRAVCLTSYSTSESTHVTGTCHAVLHLAAGQKVWLRNVSGSALYFSIPSAFSGALLHADT